MKFERIYQEPSSPYTKLFAPDSVSLDPKFVAEHGVARGRYENMAQRIVENFEITYYNY